MSQTGSESSRSSATSFSCSFEVYSAIGGDPEYDQVDDLFIAASKDVLNIKCDDDQTINLTSRRSFRRARSETKTQLSTDVEVIDCDKLGVYFGSEDGIVCFSVVVSILVSSKDGDVNQVSTAAKNLALAAELAIANGEFMDTLQKSEAPISVLLMEKAPDSSSADENDIDHYVSSYGEDDSGDCVSSCDENDNDDYASSSDADNFDFDDDDDLSSLDPGEFDDFLEISYREYLQDVNRKEILLRINPPKSPSTVSDFPSEGSDPSLLEIGPPYSKTKRRSETKIKFNPVVRVKNTLSRHEMTPKERFNYWNGSEDSLSIKDRDRMLELLTDKWHEEERSRKESKEGLAEMSRSFGMPVLPDIKQLLPTSEREGHDGYTYTISIRG